MSKHRQQRGFTLLEMMVAGTLLSMILAAAMSVLITFNVSTQQTVLFTDLQGNARLSLETLAADLRSAGVGASNGTVGVAPGAVWSARIPTIFSGPLQTFKDPSGNNYTMRSIYIVGADVSTMGISGAGDGIEAVITGPSDAKMQCTTATGALVDCKASSIGSDGVEHGILLSTGVSSFKPLLVHDHQRASLISPTSLTGSAPSQSLAFTEQLSPSISPDPSAPFGFAQGFQVSRARVVHWYLLQPDPAAPPRLYRSTPALDDGNGTCALPFMDETTVAGGVQGREMGAGPIESLQVRYVFDGSQRDNPTLFSVTDTIDPCTTTPATMRQLREVRVQMVAIAKSPAKNSSEGKIITFGTPTFEGAGGSTGVDPYPRRSYVTRIAPRNMEPYHL